jgi:hypothetical protein
MINTNKNKKEKEKKKHNDKNDLVDNENSKKKKQVFFKDFLEEPVLKSIKLNYIYFITQLVSVFAITMANGTNFLWGVITFLLITFLGYCVHYISHHINFTELYDTYNNNNLFTKNKYVDYLIRLYCKSIDFHDITHHNSSINKNVENVVIEFIMNFFMQAGWFLVVMFVIKNMDYYVVILWGLFYPSFHLINYTYIKSQTHINHHANRMSNYGIDFWDLIFYTKYNDDYNEIENINHYSINLIILTGLIVLFMKKSIK